MIERLIIIVLMFAFTNAQEIFLFGPRDEILGLEGDEARGIMRWSWIALYVPLVALTAPRMRRVLAAAGSDPWLALLLIMGVVSVAWSVAPEDTLRRSLALLMTAGLGYYVAALHDPVSQFRMLAVALTLATGIGLLAGLLVPEIGVMTMIHPGAWRGVFVNKNMFGAVAALNCIILLVLWVLDAASRVWLALALIASLTALLLSQSLTALITTVGVAAVLVCVAMLRRQRSVGSMLVLASLCVAIGILMLTSVDTILVWSGRDPTLTGRTLIWQVTWELIQQRPILGYGYGAFWLEGGEPASVLQEAVRWATPTAHNGYMDLLLELGFVGLILFALSALMAILGLLAGIRHGDRALLLSCCASLAFVLLYNVAESAMLEQHHFLTFLYVWAAATARNVGARRAGPAEWRASGSPSY